jgi:hypothetical protein
MLALTDFSPQGREPPPPASPPPGLPGQGEMLLRGVVGLSRQPLRALSVLPRTLRYLDRNPALRLVPGVRLLGGAVRVLPPAATVSRAARPTAPPRRPDRDLAEPDAHVRLGEVGAYDDV